MKKLIYLIILLLILGLVLTGCFLSNVGQVPANEQSGVSSLTKASPTWTVGPSGCDFTTIQAAIDAAIPGDTINVGPGTYDGNLIVYKEGLTIQSTDGAAQTFIDASLVDKSTYTNSWGKGINYSWAENNKPGLLRNGFDIWSDNVTIDGFTINNAEHADGYNQGIGILVGSIATTYAGFIPWNIDQWGGLVSPVDQPKPTGVTLRNNIIDGASDGIYLWASSGNLVEYNEIKNTQPLGGTGIQVYDGGTNNIIQYNAIDNAVDAISICGAWPNILLDVSDTQVIGNTLINSNMGIKFYNISGTNVMARNNTFQGNNYGIMVDSVGNATVASAHYNDFIGNIMGVQNSASTGEFDATYNWWNHPGGPRRPAGNSGKISGPKDADRVSENVLYHPWLSGADSVSNIALDQTATASATYLSYTANLAVDGDYSTLWNAGAHPTQWIEIDLGKGSTVVGLRLLTAQSPVGDTTHVVLFSNDGDVIADRTFSGITETEQWLEAWFDAPFHGVKTLRVTTTVSPSWVAWYEIEVYGWQ